VAESTLARGLGDPGGIVDGSIVVDARLSKSRSTYDGTRFGRGSLSVCDCRRRWCEARLASADFYVRGIYSDSTAPGYDRFSPPQRSQGAICQTKTWVKTHTQTARKTNLKIVVVTG